MELLLVVSEGGKGCGVGKQTCFWGAIALILYASDFLKIIKGHAFFIKGEHQTSLYGLLLPIQGKQCGDASIHALWSLSCACVIYVTLLSHVVFCVPQKFSMTTKNP